MKEIFEELRELYDNFKIEYDDVVEGTCGACGFCCSSNTKFPDVSRLEKDFLEDFLKISSSHPSIDRFNNFMVKPDSDYCPFYIQNLGCSVYPARPLFCRMYGIFKFEGDNKFPEGCIYDGNHTDVNIKTRYELIRYLPEFMELRYRYNLLKSENDDERLEALIRYGEEYIRQDKPEMAFPLFEAADKLDPQNCRVFFNFGIIHRAMGILDKAAENLEKSIKLGGEKDFPYVHQNLGFIYLNLNLIDKSYEAFSRAMILEPHIALPYMGMVFVNLARGEIQEASKNCKKALEIEPHNEQALKIMEHL